MSGRFGGMEIFRVCFFLFFIFNLSLMPPEASAAPYHKITVDGDLTDWAADEKIVSDTGDGTFNNRIDAVYVTWDADNLYIGVNYKTDGDGILIYLDTDYDGGNGYDDLTGIDTWDKDAQFSVSGFHPDFMYGSWDGDDGNFYVITSSTTASWKSVNSNTDFSTDVPGTEIELSWNTLYTGGFPAGARIALFASLCDGSALADDSAPDNISATLPSADTCTAVACDLNGDASPDTGYAAGFEIKYVNAAKIFSPNGDGLNDSLNVKIFVNQPSQVTLRVYSMEGAKIWSGSAYQASAGECSIVWPGTDSSLGYPENGIYILNAGAVNASGEKAGENRAVAVVK